jgi:hypothetical protein
MPIEGHIFGLIYDASNKKIIRDATVTSNNNSLAILMPSPGGIYFAGGNTGLHRIRISANNYKTKDLQVDIQGSFQRRDIYLST